MEHHVISISGMSCTGCEKILQRAVSALDGVKSVQADYQKSEMQVDFVPPCSLQQIYAAVRDAGYEAVQRPQKDHSAAYILIILLGLFTAQNNLVLTGLSMPVSGGGSYTEAAAADVRDGVQYVTTYLHPNGYDDIAVSAGKPVVWTIIVQEGSLNGCNRQLVITAFGLQVSLEEGENVIAFTPVEEGSYPYSCWMGMLKNTIRVDGAE